VANYTGIAIEHDEEASPPISRHLAALDKQMSSLSEQVHLLEQRLQPVLGPDYPDENKPAIAPVPDASEVARQLDDLRDRLSASYQRLQRLMTRLDL